MGNLRPFIPGLYYQVLIANAEYEALKELHQRLAGKQWRKLVKKLKRRERGNA